MEQLLAPNTKSTAAESASSIATTTTTTLVQAWGILYELSTFLQVKDPMEAED
jgi:hypothetical protein